MARLTILLALAAVLGGCVGASSEDQHAKANEFNEQAVEKAMNNKGQQKDLEDAKKREAAYLAAGKSSSSDQQQEGPVTPAAGSGN